MNLNILACIIKYVFFSEQIGPNVSISANVRVGAGVRLIGCIVLDDVEIKVWKWIPEMCDVISSVYEQNIFVLDRKML